MGYSEKSHEFIGLDLEYMKGGDRSVVWLDEATGILKRRLLLTEKPFESEFALKGTILVTSEGALIDTSTGKELARLDFPRESGGVVARGSERSD
jgi:hypothetical protein